MAKSAFTAMYEEVFGAGQDANCDELYTFLTNCLAVSLSALVQDPALAFIVESIGSAIDQRLTTVESNLFTLLGKNQAFQGHEQLSLFLQKWARASQGQFRNITVETNKGAKKIEISRIFIPSKLRYRREPDLIRRLLEVRKIDVKGVSSRPNREMDENQISYPEFQAAFRRVVVLGDPGGGKSTLCQYLCYQLSRNFAESGLTGAATSKSIDPQAARIPIRITLRHFESARSKTAQLGVFDYIVNEVKAAIACSDECARYAVDYVLSLGQAVLAFDGLDEILNTATRRDFVNLVTAFCNEYSLCPVVVTSRLVGYVDAPLTDDFEELVLEKLDGSEVKTFVDKFLRVVAGYKADRAAQEATKFLRQTERVASDLRQNPLMLGLMAFLFANKGDVPTNRPEIYQECAVLMFEKWDQNRNIIADIPRGFDLLDLFTKVASSVFGNPDLEEGVDFVWIEKLNRKYFSGLFESQAKVNDAAKRVTKFLTGRSWILSEFGVNKYGFSHRTFLEYFFARHLNDEHETVEALLGNLMPRIIKYEWDVICHLALQIKTFRGQRRTAQAVAQLESAIACQDSSLLERLAVASFAAGALQYFLGAEGQLRTLLVAMADVMFEAVDDGKVVEAAALFWRSTLCIAERREHVLAVLGSRLASAIADGNIDRRAFAYAIASSDVVRNELLRRERPDWSAPTALTTGLRTRVKAAVEKKALTNAFDAHICFEWYGTNFEELFKIHGLEMLFAERRPTSMIPSQLEPCTAIVAGLDSTRINRHSVRHAKDFISNTLGAIGRWADTDRALSAGAAHVSALATTAGTWLHPLTTIADDRDAVRGLLICLAVNSAFISPQAPEHTEWPFFHGHRADNARLIRRVDDIIDRWPTEAQAKVRFWSQRATGSFALFDSVLSKRERGHRIYLARR